MRSKHAIVAALAACLLLIITHSVEARQFAGSSATAAVGSAAASAAAEASAAQHALEDAGNRPWFCR